MPLTTSTVSLPAEVRSVTAGDVNDDGRDELILESRLRSGDKPEQVRLTIVSFDAAGHENARRAVDLGNRAAFWDAAQGLWLVDREGLAKVDASGTTVRVAKLSTPLANLGPTTPYHSVFSHDLDGDGRVELVVWATGRYHVYHATGVEWGSVPAASQGRLNSTDDRGGVALSVSAAPPRLVLADMDGDGNIDLLLPRGEQLEVYYTGATIGERAATVRLPVDLDPPEVSPRPGEIRREVSAVWLEDLNGDQKVDLAVHRTVYGGTFFGATAELVFATGDGSSFAAAETVPIPQAAFGVEPVDADGDGNREMIAALVDVGVSNLARALVSKEVKAELSLFRQSGNEWQSAPTAVRTIRFPIETPDAFHLDVSGDVDGDGRDDLLTDDGTHVLSVYRGGANGFTATAAWTTPMTVAGPGGLYVHDLTGDGRAEVLMWQERAATATLIRVSSP